MFNNRLHLGTVFGLILLAPIILILSVVIAELEYGDYYTEDILIFGAVLLLLSTSAVGMFTKKVWALRLLSFILIGILVLSTFGMLSEGVDLIDIEMIGIFLMIGLFVFGSIALLNNDIVLEQFGAKETFDDLDDILDTDEY